MPRPRFTATESAKVLNKTQSKCHHCGCVLNGNDRSSWHIDHFPVPYRDIEDQICCGVTNAKDIDNLVPSCITCNTSHKFEPQDKWYFCNATQPRCRANHYRLLVAFCAGFCVGTVVTLYLNFSKF